LTVVVVAVVAVVVVAAAVLLQGGSTVCRPVPVPPADNVSLVPQVSRVLKPRGRFISLTFAQPHFRKPLYARRRYGWDVGQHTYGDGFHYFLYVMTKGQELSPEDAALEARLSVADEAEGTPARITVTQDVETDDFLRNIDL